MGDTMNKRHCDKCDKIIAAEDEQLCMVKVSVRSVEANISRYDDGHGWVSTSDYCRKCLGMVMVEYSQWLLRTL